MAFLNIEDLVGSVEVILFPNTYEKYASLLVEDAKVFVKGHVSVEDDKDGKLICDQLVTFEEAGNAGDAPIFQSRGGRFGGGYGGGYRQPQNSFAQGDGAGPAQGAQSRPQGIPNGIWIQFADANAYNEMEQRLLEVIKDSDGNDDVVIFLKDTKAFKVLPVNRRVKADEELKLHLSEIFGAENVKIRIN